MILNFKVKNYRSYKDEVTFTMLADSSRSKTHNIAEPDANSLPKTLKTAVIFGPNASGKSNILLALGRLVRYIVDKPRFVDLVSLYEPFLFDQEAAKSPCEFDLEFVGPGGVHYYYQLKVKEDTVLSESLDYLKGSQRKPLLIRNQEIEGQVIQKGYVVGEKNQRSEISVFANQLLLSKFGIDDPHEVLSPIFKYFANYELMINRTPGSESLTLRNLNRFLTQHPRLMHRLIRMIRFADTGIEDLKLRDISEENERHVNPFRIDSFHSIYEQGEKTNEYQSLNFREESRGSQMLYLLGGIILMVLDTGGVLLVDELDTSLHPLLTNLIVRLFQSKKLNKNNAQLIFTSHDVSLMDRELLRKDQIWLAEKSRPGVSALFSLQDFDNLREDTPFEKWYMAGKFGGLPQIKSLDSIFDGEDED